MGDRNPKRPKTLLTWFKPSSSSARLTESVNHEIGNEKDGNVSKDVYDDVPSLSIPIEDDCNDKSGKEDIFDITLLERDPGKRRPICKYPLNERDSVRRAYVVLGPHQPHLSCYPSTWDGFQDRKFCHKWFTDWTWLEYSLEKDRAYCFPCFLFDAYPSHHPNFTEIGFNGWKNAMSKKSGILKHIGDLNSKHNSSMHKWENLRNPTKHIERVISTLEVVDNRLRLVATIEVVKVLARQGCSFRGNDESYGSLNSGYFDAILDLLKRVNEEYHRVLDNAPKNAKYTSPTIQKQIANILGNKVRTKIRDEIGESKFCILVDEALDVAGKEQMAIILRFVDKKGAIKERFFKVISVVDTCSQTLKDEICKVLTQYDLKVENIRGQGYDGASNMRGQFNGLQALFLRECSYAYYVHCFAHRLQLTLNAAAKGVSDVWQFFSTLNMIVNFVDSSAKRHSLLKACREGEIQDLVAAGTLITGSGMNQTCTLQRAGATRWGSHIRSISSLIKLFGATRATIDDLYKNGEDKVKGEAKGVGKAMKKFDFIFCLLLMNEVMKITEFLSQAFQKKDIDILNAVELLSITKAKLQDMRMNGWDDLLLKVEIFCSEHCIIMPNMSSPFKKGLRDNEINITNEHYYRVNVLYAVVDYQLAELRSRFAERSVELLVLSASFHPRNGFRAFKAENVCQLASKFYPLDFSTYDVEALSTECGFFLASIESDSTFTNMSSVSDLGRLMVESGKSEFYPMIYRLINLILTLPVSTATTERAFSSMNIIKNKLRNKMNDEFLDDLMVLYVERTFADGISNDDVITEFEVTGPRRVKFT